MKDNKLDLINAIQTKAAFSYAIAVMDRIGGWEEGDEQKNWASLWIYTKAVACNEQRHVQTFRIKKLSSIMEAVNWVCDDALDDHTWV